MSLSYARVNWSDYPETNSPLTASNLNIMDKGIDDVVQNLTDNGEEFKFGFDGTNYGYYKSGSNTLTPFKNPTGNINLAGNASGADVAAYATATVKHTGERASAFTTSGRKDLGESHNYRYININVAGLRLLGEYSDNTTINASTYGITSTSQVIIVPSGKTVSASGGTGTDGSYGMGWCNAKAIYTEAVVSLSGNTLSITAPTLYAWGNGPGAKNCNKTEKMTYKVYYIG